MQLNEKFLAFDTAHPDVWWKFESFTLALIARGKKHGSSDAVMHRIRWDYETSSSGETPKLNNIFSLRASQADPRPHELAHTAREPETQNPKLETQAA